jgi:hypothetical protein
MMDPILRPEKKDTGIEVVWQEIVKREEQCDLIPHAEFDKMRVQVGDLIAHPGAYRIDLQERREYMSAKGGKSF